MANSCVIPEDTIFCCILTRLPVKSIIRFKSVCKAWLHLLSTREFVKSHHAQFSSDPKNECFLMDGRPIGLFKVEPNMILDISCSFSISDFVGCCNGLVCLRGKDNIILWNPAMKLFKSIGFSKYAHPTRIERMSLGFGYDAEVDDYKLVRIVYFEIEEGDMDMEDMDMDMQMEMDRIEVYSVNSDSWITIDPGFQIHTRDNNTDVIVNGNPYWVAEVCENGSARNHSCDSLVCFDVKKMAFKKVPLFKPIVNEPTVNEDDEDARFVDWNGCLGALVCIEDKERVVKSIDVWVFVEGEQAWRMYYTFRTIDCWVFDEGEQVWTTHPTIDCWVFDEGEQDWRTRPTYGAPNDVKNLLNWGWKLLCSKNGKIMFKGPDELMFVFDSDIGSIKEVGKRGSYFELFPYTESLTYIEGMKGFTK